MKTSSDLHRLIRSLTPAEKRYFKLFSSQQGKRKNYVDLFDALAAQQEYDEAALRRKFAGEKFLKQFNVARKYLYDLIMKALVNFHATASVSGEIRDLLSRAEILFQRGLSDLAERSGEKALELAEQHDLIVARMQALVVLRRIRQPDITAPEVIAEIFEPQHETIEQLQKQITMGELYFRSSVLRKSGEAPNRLQKELKALVENDLLYNEEADEPFTVSYLRHSTWINYYHMFGLEGSEFAFHHAELQLALIEAHPEQIREQPQLYLHTLGLCLGMSRHAGKYREHQGYLERMKQEVPRFTSIGGLRAQRSGAAIFEEFTMRYIGSLVAFGYDQQVIDLHPTIEANLKEYDHLINPEFSAAIYLFLSSSYLNEERPAEARRCAGTAIIIADERGPASMRIYPMLTAMALHWESGDLDYLAYLVRKGEEILADHEHPPLHTRLLVDLFASLPDIPDESSRRMAFGRVAERMQQVMYDAAEINFSSYFPFYHWLEAGASGRTLSQVREEYFRALTTEPDSGRETTESGEATEILREVMHRFRTRRRVSY